MGWSKALKGAEPGWGRLRQLPAIGCQAPPGGGVKITPRHAACGSRLKQKPRAIVPSLRCHLRLPSPSSAVSSGAKPGKRPERGRPHEIRRNYAANTSHQIFPASLALRVQIIFYFILLLILTLRNPQPPPPCSTVLSHRPSQALGSVFCILYRCTPSLFCPTAHGHDLATTTATATAATSRPTQTTETATTESALKRREIFCARLPIEIWRYHLDPIASYSRRPRFILRGARAAMFMSSRSIISRVSPVEAASKHLHHPARHTQNPSGRCVSGISGTHTTLLIPDASAVLRAPATSVCISPKAA